jgi:signal transduction histidine kinase
VKYGRGEPGAAIVVETRRDDREAMLAVTDRGPGIAPQDRPRIFEPFYRSPEARRKGAAGVGLGLAVVRRIATACGGSVSVRSEPGEGARFEVRFPMMPTPIEPIDAPAAIDRSPAAGVESRG